MMKMILVCVGVSVSGSCFLMVRVASFVMSVDGGAGRKGLVESLEGQGCASSCMRRFCARET
jgi:hypothetical protein